MRGDLDVLGVPMPRLSGGKKTTFRGRTMGFVFQQFSLLPALTAAENVAVPLLIRGLVSPDLSVTRSVPAFLSSAIFHPNPVTLTRRYFDHFDLRVGSLPEV
jgi:ABC-type lipoprotein export system ATPase subunit